MNKNRYRGEFNKWLPSPADVWQWGKRWELLRLNPNAGYYQEVGRVVRLEGVWKVGRSGESAEGAYNSPQEAAKELLKQLSQAAT